MIREPVGPFGQQLHQYRERRGLTQEELAERAGLSVDAISALERGTRRRPHRHTVRALIAALNLGELEASSFASTARPVERRDIDGATVGPPAGLPSPLTPLVGRAREIATACNLLQQSEVRLLTLTGPGGIGKTRIALAVAGEVIDAFGDGAAFVDLSSNRDEGLVATAIAGVVGIREGGDRPIVDRLKSHFRARTFLLVLDNFEHLLAAAPLVAELLTACRGLKVLATSRARLHLTGEQPMRIPPLTWPDPSRRPSPPQLLDFPATQLFVERARAVNSSLTVTPANAPVIAEICARLDGLPLAIELAAARLDVLSPQALLKRLGNRLAVLTNGPRDHTERLRTMRNAIAWSHDLLDPEEQALFRRLAVFPGGCTLEAADAVYGGWAAHDCPPDTVDVTASSSLPTILCESEAELLELLASLVSKSLLVREDGRDGEPRFRMLETIREYGLERLHQSGEIEEAHRRLVAWAVALVAAADAEIDYGPEGLRWFDCLDTEYPNLRQALDWSRRRGDVADALGLGGRLWMFWWLGGYYSEGRSQLDAILSMPGAYQHRAAQASALTGLGVLAHKQGEYEQAVRWHQAAIAAWRGIDDDVGLFRALWAFGFALLSTEPERAAPLFEESHEVARAAGNPWYVAFSHWGLGTVDLYRGDVQRAAAHLEQVPDDDDPWARSFLRWAVGQVALAQGRIGRAAECLGEALALFQALNQPWGSTRCLEGLATVAIIRDDVVDAAHLFGAAAELREAMGIPIPPVEQASIERAVATVREQLGESVFAAAWERGRSLPVEHAIAKALADVGTCCGNDE